MLTIDDKATAETLVSLNSSVHAWHASHFPDLFRDNADEGLLQYFKASLERPDCFHFVALDDTTPIGFVQSEIRSHNGSPFRQPQKLVYIVIVVVVPTYRGKGVGRKLIERVFDLARSRGIDRVELDHWDGNDAALVFEKLGFRPYRHDLAINLGANGRQAT
jgi:ribosomal protein S18 acetylase RimI-like enzyme